MMMTPCIPKLSNSVTKGIRKFGETEKQRKKFAFNTTHDSLLGSSISQKSQQSVSMSGSGSVNLSTSFGGGTGRGHR